MSGTLSTLFLVAAAGGGLVLQNALMARIASGGAMLGALFVNSLVGILLLAALSIWLDGAGFAATLLERARPFWLLPGLLGTFFVFASVTGYRTLGAAPTIALLIASQLCCGLLADSCGLVGETRAVGVLQWLGAVFLVLGALLTLSSRG